MSYRTILNVFGRILLIEACLLLPAMVVAALHGEPLEPFYLTMAALLVIGSACLAVKKKKQTIYAREGFIIVALSWVGMSVMGALPFMLSGHIPSFIDALFETISGFTTTGASILTNVEALPYGLLFWRSFTHWVGGMGVLVFMLAVLPLANVRSVHIMRAEVPGPTKGKLVPKMRSTAMILYGIYIIMTVIEVILLVGGGMSLFDALLHSFGTAGTGGFGIKNTSVGYYNSAYFDVVIGIFMMLFGINFNLYYLLLLRNIKGIFRSEEFRLYIAIIVVCTAIITVDILSMFGTVAESLRYAFFQVSSITTTTGYSTTDFNLWPSLSKTILAILMLIGACAGSTAGGLKVSRVLILCKSSLREIRRLLNPNSVSVVKLDRNTLDETTIHGSIIYFGMYMIILFISILLVSVDGFNFETSSTAVFSCLGNIGPGLGDVGPAASFAGFSVFSKLVLSLNMLLGRLEIYPILLLFSPATWRRK
ncbi:MAG: TrkH family potassium uptake protein [Christensenellales bacterium]|jgi:trk system potassium uptake protein TrkH